MFVILCIRCDRTNLNLRANCVIQKAENIEKIPAATLELKKATIEQRRCILLALAGATPKTSPSLSRILANGYLVTVKSWLNDILNGSVGKLVSHQFHPAKNMFSRLTRIILNFFFSCRWD